MNKTTKTRERIYDGRLYRLEGSSSLGWVNRPDGEPVASYFSDPFEPIFHVVVVRTGAEFVGERFEDRDDVIYRALRVTKETNDAAR